MGARVERVSDYIRKAIELAGFDTHDERELRVLTNHGIFYVDYDEQFFLDALAAQLVRQVDALGVDIYELSSEPLCSRLVRHEGIDGELVAEVLGPDRTMNTIKAIVDSGGLKKENGNE